MQRRANQKYLLVALLPLFVIAVALWGAVPPKNSILQENIPVSISKTLIAHQNDVPLVSNDVPQISRAEHRSPTQNWVILLSLLIVLSAFKVNGKRIAIFSLVKYSCLFKTLFPAHEFS